MFQRAAGLKMTHVPYRGMPQATNDVVAGHTQLVFTDPPLAQSLTADGKLRALAVSTLERIPAVPTVPSLHELGFKEFEAVSWHMVVAPAGTPRPIVDKLHAELKTIVASPEFQQQTLKMGLSAIDSPPPDALKRYLDDEIARWGELVKQVGIAGTQ